MTRVSVSELESQAAQILPDAVFDFVADRRCSGRLRRRPSWRGSRERPLVRCDVILSDKPGTTCPHPTTGSWNSLCASFPRQLRGVTAPSTRASTATWKVS
jgi:hypothetical protein